MKILNIITRGIIYSLISNLFRSPVGSFVLGILLGYILSFQNLLILNI